MVVGAYVHQKLRALSISAMLILVGSVGPSPTAMAQSTQVWNASEFLETFPSQNAALAAIRARGGRYALAERIESVTGTSTRLQFHYSARPRPPLVGEWEYTGNGVEPGPVASGELAAELTLANFKAKYPECGFQSIEILEDWRVFQSALGVPNVEARILKMEATSPIYCSRTFTVQHWKRRVVECPKLLAWNGSQCVSGIVGSVWSSPIPCDPCDLRGNPISVVSGSKVQSEVDVDLDWIQLDRTFDSSFPTLGGIGRYWTHNLNARLYYAGGGGIAAVVFPGGRTVGFNALEANDGSGVVIRKDGNGYILFLEDGRYRFNSGGRLFRIERYAGDAVDIEFDSLQRISRVVHSSGRSIEFGYTDAQTFGESELAFVKDQDGILVAYTFDEQVRLTGVAYRDGTSRHYLYEHAKYKWLLTGIEDEGGTRFATYTYNDAGLAVASEHAGGVQKHTFLYGADGATTHTNPLGGVERVAFSAANPYRKITSLQTLRGTESWTYAVTNGATPDFRRRVTSHTDAAGNISIFAYRTQTDPLLGDVWIKRSTEASNRPEQRVSEIWRRRDTNQVVRVVSAASAVTWLRNDRGQVLDQTIAAADGLTRTSTYSYCDQAGVDRRACPVLGLLLSVDGPMAGNADTVTYSYYDADAPDCASASAACIYRKGDLRKVTNPMGDYTEVLAYDPSGRPQAVMDPNGVVTEYGYSARGWLTAMTIKGESSSDDRTTSIEYQLTGLVGKVTAPDGAATTYSYDAAQRLIGIADGAGNGIHYTLDNAGNRLAEETRGAGGLVTRSLSRIYDQLSQLTTLADASANPTDFTYDPNGNLATVTDALGRVSLREHDAFGRLKRVLEDAHGIAAESRMGYDAEDNLLRVTDPKGLDTTYRYNGLGDFIAQQSPDTGGTDMTVDAAGNTRTRTDARGVRATYQYDVLNRLTGISYPDSSLDVGYTYDTAPAVCEADERFAKGRVGQVSHAKGHTTYCYDRFGQITRKVQTLEGVSTALRYAYTKAGKLAKLTYPDGSVADYVRDGLGRITQIGLAKAGHGRQVVVTDVTYAPFGPPTGWTYGDGRRLQRPVDQDYRPKAVLDSAVGGLSLGYGYDPVGNITELKNGTGSEVLARYGYDALGRLTQTKDGATGTPIETYAYDATGNRTSLTTSSGTAVYSYSADSHWLTAVDGAVRNYDAAGNTVSLDGKVLVYTDANRMGQVKQSGESVEFYTYNHRGERILRAPSIGVSQSTMYDEGGQWLGNYGETGQSLQQAIWLDNHPVGLMGSAATASPELVYLQPDHLGTPRVAVDPSRDVVMWEWSSKGEVFGNQIPNVDPDGDGAAFEFALRFPGQQATAASGLSYNYFREYEPVVGRYSQSDPIGLRGGPTSYGYAGLSPVSKVDPLGLVAWHGYAHGIGFGGGNFAFAKYNFHLISECVDGKMAVVDVNAHFAGGGFGSPVTYTVSNVVLEDGSARLDPENLRGAATMYGAGLSVGGGAGYSSFTLGMGYSAASWSGQGGWDASVYAYPVGYSVLDGAARMFKCGCER